MRKQSCSRDAIRTRVIVTRINKATKLSALRPDLRQRIPAVDTGILMIGERSEWRVANGELVVLCPIRCSPLAIRQKKKARKRNAERRVSNLRTLRGAARAERCALASRRPTTALARGTLVPKALLQARLPGTWSVRALPGVACPSPVAAPHAPVVMPASMMPEAARE